MGMSMKMQALIDWVGKDIDPVRCSESEGWAASDKNRDQGNRVNSDRSAAAFLRDNGV